MENIDKDSIIRKIERNFESQSAESIEDYGLFAIHKLSPSRKFTSLLSLQQIPEITIEPTQEENDECSDHSGEEKCIELRPEIAELSLSRVPKKGTSCKHVSVELLGDVGSEKEKNYGMKGEKKSYIQPARQLTEPEQNCSDKRHANDILSSMSGNRSQQSFAPQHENPCIVIAQPQLSRIPNSEPHNLDSLNASNRRALLHPTTSSAIEEKIKVPKKGTSCKHVSVELLGDVGSEKEKNYGMKEEKTSYIQPTHQLTEPEQNCSDKRHASDILSSMSGNRSQQSFASQHENPCIVIAQPQLSRIPNSEPHNLDSLNASNRRALLHPTTSSVIEGKIKSSSFIKSRRGTIVSSEPVVNIFDYASHPQNQIQGPRLSICAQPENLAANIPDIQPTLSGTEFRVSQEQDEDHRLRRRRSINSRFYFCMHDRGGVDAIKNTKSNLILESNVTEDYSGDILSNHGIVKLNISGTLFHVRRSTLENDPLVYQGILEQAIWLEQRREYYLERDPMVFRFVFHYLRFGDLHLPGNLCGPFLEKELQSWGIQMGFEVQRCCLGAVMETKVNLDSLKHFEQDLRGENIKPRHMIR